jgi:hypothetical protein
MSGKPLLSCSTHGTNEAGRDGVGSTSPALEHSEPEKEVRHMSLAGSYIEFMAAIKRQAVA